MRNVMKRVGLFLVSVGLALTGGCLAVVAGGAAAAGVLYIKGELKATLAAKPEKVVEATKAALKDMKIAVVNAEATAVDGKVNARTATDKKIKITVTREAKEVSKVVIRVGTFGDEEISRQILDKIKSKL